MEDNEFICVKCGKHQETCCQTAEVYITLGDVRRISEYTGKGDFYEDRLPEDPVYTRHDDDPIWYETAMQPDGKRRVLKRRENGDCMFLGTAGCVLPLETRPLLCRIYPFDFNQQGIKPELANGCPVELLRKGETLLQALDMNKLDAERWHGLLYEEILEEPHYRAKQSGKLGAN
jgi:Fe-S-cluster containining protein